MALLHKMIQWDHRPEEPPSGRPGRQFRVVPRREPVLFQSIEYVESRKNAVLVSVVVHGVLLAVALAIPLFLYDSLNIKRYYPVTLVPPPPPKQVLEVTHWKPVAPPKPLP